MCIDSQLSNFNTYGQDCSGTCNGNFALDECSVCLDKESSDWNSCIGCDNVPNSGEIENECGVCANPNDVHFDEYGKDCSGQCARVVSEQHYIDECGKCLMVSDPLWNECVGCDGKPNSGKEFNTCGRCVSKNDSNFDDYGKDCRGICSSSVADTYYVDECNQCLLPSDPKWNDCLSLTTQIPTTSPTYSYSNHPTVIPTRNPTIYQFDTTYSYSNYPTVILTRNVEKQAKSITNSVSMVMVLIVVIGVLILLLCLCGGYILYGKYKKNRNIHLEYIQNIISVDGEGDINVDEQDYDESGQSRVTSAVAQTNKL